MFEANMFKLCFTMNFNNFKCFGFYNHQSKVKIFTNFEKEWCEFDNENGFFKKPLSTIVLNMQKDLRFVKKTPF